MLVLRELVHHRLGIARARRSTVRLVRKLVLLMGRAVLRLVWLRVRASHGRHRSWWHLVHLRALRTGLHVRHGRLLMPLL